MKRHLPSIYLAIVTAISVILAFCLWNGCVPVQAAEIPSLPYKYEITTDKAILSIIGEAENQGYTGMLAIACAIRNRGTLRGVYGLNAPRVKNQRYSKKTYEMAQKAWFASYRVDVTNGATHWENIKAFGCPKWVKACVETFRYKDHIFYKTI